MDKKIPYVIKRWYEKVIKECQEEAGGDENILWKIRMKIRHTRRVVKWGKLIMEGENWKGNYGQGLSVCLLHDIGRFPQALLGTYIDKKSINHALKGREIFEKEEWDLSSFEGKREEIAEAIGEHNNPNYKGDNIYVKLARDADQLAITEELEEQSKDCENVYEKSGSIRSKLANKFNKKIVINSKEARTIAEWMLCVRSWERMFNFDTSKKIYKSSNFGKLIKNKYLNMFPKETISSQLFD